MKSRVYHTTTGKAGTVIRDNDVPIVQWDDGTQTTEQWSNLTAADAAWMARCQQMVDEFDHLNDE